MKRLQESRTVEISPSGLTRGVGLTTHSYSTSGSSLFIDEELLNPAVRGAVHQHFQAFVFE
jgi:hypothetical protein